ncbi:hypothetical protein EVAR_94174_1 [Eumeta japonica]|uniref:Uncharacterized protein n=1 Tax=Eumeta variegata TaxID=151549 RepID=A0A4C1UP77_EUMVA|nr:hypothetical protein EVAR_94174_1 [Eumeta japonica]
MDVEYAPSSFLLDDLVVNPNFVLTSNCGPGNFPDFDPKYTFNSNPSPTCGFDHGVVDSAPRPAFSSDTTIDHASDFNKWGKWRQECKAITDVLPTTSGDLEPCNKWYVQRDRSLFTSGHRQSLTGIACWLSQNNHHQIIAQIDTVNVQ